MNHTKHVSLLLFSLNLVVHIFSNLFFQLTIDLLNLKKEIAAEDTSPVRHKHYWRIALGTNTGAGNELLAILRSLSEWLQC